MSQHLRALLIGCNGFLGKAIHRHFTDAGTEIVGTARNPGPNQFKLDLMKPITVQLRPELEKTKFTHGILCAAFADVETCYRDPAGSARVNVEAIAEILELFSEYGVTPIFFSSDLVFNSSQDFYKEEDPATFETRYGMQKAAVERLIRDKFPTHLIYRTSKLMALWPDRKNILSHVIENLRENVPVKAFRDQFITPVFVEDVSEAVERSIPAGPITP